MGKPNGGATKLKIPDEESKDTGSKTPQNKTAIEVPKKVPGSTKASGGTTAPGTKPRSDSEEQKKANDKKSQEEKKKELEQKKKEELEKKKAEAEAKKNELAEKKKKEEADRK